MQFASIFNGRLVAAALVVTLLAPAAEAAPISTQQAASTTSAQAGSVPTTSAHEPTRMEFTAEAALPDNPSPAPTPAPQFASQSDKPATSQAAPEQQQQDAPQKSGSKPVGTAAAPYEKTLGVAASRPAGAVIAPAKQRRVRTIWISVAAVVGAGIAVGTVVGLSKASSSRP